MTVCCAKCKLMPTIIARESTTGTVLNNSLNPTDSYFIRDKTLGLLRLIFAVLITTHVTWRLVEERGGYFYYLTNWNWILNLAYFWVAATHKRPSSSPFLNTLFASSQSISWIVTLVFWVLLFDATDSAAGLSSQIISHSFNLIFPLIDLFLCRIILHLPHIVCPIVFTLLYMVGVIIFHLVFSKAWPYSFLETLQGTPTGIGNVGYTIAFVVGLWIVVGLFFGLSILLIWIRERFGSRILKKNVPQDQHVEMEHV